MTEPDQTESYDAAYERHREEEEAEALAFEEARCRRDEALAEAYAEDRSEAW